MNHRPQLLFAILFCLILTTSALAEGGQLPARSALRASDEAGLSLTLRFDAAGFKAMDQGLYLALDGCALESADADDPRASGAPMLPVWRGLVALPPGTRPSLSWRLLEAEAVGGRPLPFPTPRAQGRGDSRLYVEELIEDPAAFARAHPIRVRLGEVRRLRDLLTVEVIAEPVGWNPGEEGLRLATELALDLRFRPDAAARAAGALREAPRRAEKHWDRIYAGALLNGELARDWKRRVPSRSQVGRSARAEASLKLLCAEDGLYGVPGSDLIAYGIAAGTPLSEIALYRHRFGWDAQEQPVFEQIAEPRYFLDLGATPDQLDAEDVLVFMGWRLRHEPESVDAIEWYGRACARYVAVAPALALPMDSEEGWSEEGAWTPLTDFMRTREAEGTDTFLANPVPALYDLAQERWAGNIYYWHDPRHSEDFTLTLDMPSPAYVSGSAAELGIHFQGLKVSASNPDHDFLISVHHEGVETVLPVCTVNNTEQVDYAATMPADAIGEAGNTLTIEKDPHEIWMTYAKYWRLGYRSRYEATGDSLAFNADGFAGAVELAVDSLSGDHVDWQLVALRGAGPSRVLLDADNATGPVGQRSLRLRSVLSGEERWHLCGNAALMHPQISAAESLPFLEELAAYDVLAIASAPFFEGMSEWADFRRDQGYAVKLLHEDQVWDAFFAGARGAIGIRNAARFAMQQWGVEALVLAGDSSKDARELNSYSDVDYLPCRPVQEDVLGSFELVALEEWMVKFDSLDWPSLLMGRLPVGSPAELALLVAKLRCYEEGEGEPCAEGAWRRDFLHTADDCWVYDLTNNLIFECRAHEQEFEEGQATVIALSDSTQITGDYISRPWFLSALTDPWFAEWEAEHGSLPRLSDVQQYLRPIISAAFADTLSRGYGLVTVQTHANRSLLGHEEFFRTSPGADDQEMVENAGRPFVWVVYGCHGNTFAHHYEARPTTGDCLGEKLLFLSGGRGAVASYASEGYEYLFPNIALEKDLIELMFTTEEATIYPDWRLGTLQMVSELRYAQYNSSYRYNILGDPLTRLDSTPPRFRLWADEHEYRDGDFIPAMSPGDTLTLEALLVDENHVADLRLSDDVLGVLAADLTPAWAPQHRDDALFDSLLTQTDTTLAALLVPVDSLAVQAGLGSRAWHLSARLPFDPNRGEIVLLASDQTGHAGSLRLPAAKVVYFIQAAGDTLRTGQWIRPAGELNLSIRTPSSIFLPENFTLWEDGVLRADVLAGYMEEAGDSTQLSMPFGYSWGPGLHSLQVRHEGEDYDAIMLSVDGGIRLIDGLIFPNPFKNITTLRYTLTSGVRAGSLSIYTLSGRRIHRERLTALSEGTAHVLSWDGRDQQGDRVANGVYLMRMVFTDLRGEEIVWEDKIVRMR